MSASPGGTRKRPEEWPHARYKGSVLIPRYRGAPGDTLGASWGRLGICILDVACIGLLGIIHASPMLRPGATLGASWVRLGVWLLHIVCNGFLAATWGSSWHGLGAVLRAFGGPVGSILGKPLVACTYFVLISPSMHARNDELQILPALAQLHSRHRQYFMRSPYRQP